MCPKSVKLGTNPATIACDQRKLSVPGSIMVPIRKVQAVAADCRKGQACTCPALQNRIRRSANRAMDEPICSKMAKNTMAAMNNTPMAASRLWSSLP